LAPFFVIWHQPL